MGTRLRSLLENESTAGAGILLLLLTHPLCG
jgi:hypothetical protein